MPSGITAQRLAIVCPKSVIYRREVNTHKIFRHIEQLTMESEFRWSNVKLKSFLSTPLASMRAVRFFGGITCPKLNVSNFSGDTYENK